MSTDEAKDGLLALLAAAAEDQPDEQAQATQPRVIVHNPAAGRRHARPSKLLPGGPCACCGAKLSPQWRRPCPLGRDADPAALAASPAVLCNACGIYYQRHRALPDRKGMGNNYSRPDDDDDAIEEVVAPVPVKKNVKDEQVAYKGHGASTMPTIHPNSCDSSLLAANMSLLGAGVRGSPGGSGRSAEQMASVLAAARPTRGEHLAPQPVPGSAGAGGRTSSPSPSEDSSFTPRSGRKRSAAAVLHMPPAVRQASKLSHTGEHMTLLPGSAHTHGDTAAHTSMYGMPNLQHMATTGDPGHHSTAPPTRGDELQPRDSRESSAAAGTRPAWPAGSGSSPRAGLPPRPPVAHTVAAVTGQAVNAQAMHLQLQPGGAATAAPQPTVFRMQWGSADRPSVMNAPVSQPPPQPQQAPQQQQAPAPYVVRAPSTGPIQAPQQWMYVSGAPTSNPLGEQGGVTYSYVMPAQPQQQQGPAPGNGAALAAPPVASGPPPTMAVHQQPAMMAQAPRAPQYVLVAPAPQQAPLPQPVTYLTLPGGGTVQVLQAPSSATQMGMMHAPQPGGGVTMSQSSPGVQYWSPQAPATGAASGQGVNTQAPQYNAGPMMTTVMGPPRMQSQPQGQPITLMWAPQQGAAPQGMGHARPVSMLPMQGGMQGLGMPQHVGQHAQHLPTAYQQSVLMSYPAPSGQSGSGLHMA